MRDDLPVIPSSDPPRRPTLDYAAPPRRRVGVGAMARLAGWTVALAAVGGTVGSGLSRALPAYESTAIFRVSPWLSQVGYGPPPPAADVPFEELVAKAKAHVVSEPVIRSALAGSATTRTPAKVLASLRMEEYGGDIFGVSYTDFDPQRAAVFTAQLARAAVSEELRISVIAVSPPDLARRRWPAPAGSGVALAVGTLVARRRAAR